MMRRTECRYCGKAVCLASLPHGGTRSFDIALAADVAEDDRYAYSKRLHHVVDLVGQRPPDHVLATHRCREYAEARLMASVAGMDDLFGSALKHIGGEG
jgi:hypothetical protein